jgi:hypothetical protein
VFQIRVMKFHLDLDIKKLPQPITHNHRLLLVGSCFTENIGEKLKKYKFSIFENPNGILFNPVSVAEAINDCITNEHIRKEDLFELNEGWHSWKHHSRFSGVKAEDAMNKINESTTKAHQFLKEADYLMITLGSAWTYTLTEKAANTKPGAVAANNHKAPADWFRRKLMTNVEVIALLETMIERLKAFNPELKIIFTISPVRHIREGIVDNNRSKAVLIQSVHHLIEKFEYTYYFPAYELVIDDLRDYRFYAEDLVHPNYFATQYVWEKFIAACMDENTRSLMEEIHSINLAFHHKAFNPDSLQHRKFLISFLQKTRRLQESYPYLNFEKEIEYFGRGE